MNEGMAGANTRSTENTPEPGWAAIVSTTIECGFVPGMDRIVGSVAEQALGLEAPWSKNEYGFSQVHGRDVWQTGHDPERPGEGVELEDMGQGKARIQIRSTWSQTNDAILLLGEEMRDAQRRNPGNGEANPREVREGAVAGYDPRGVRQAHQVRETGEAAGALAVLTGWSMEEAGRRLEQAGGARGVAYPETSSARDALGDTMCDRLGAAKDLLRIAESQHAERIGEQITCGNDAARVLVPRLRHEGVEVLGFLALDTRHRPIRWIEMHRGGIEGSQCVASEIARQALGMRATTVILAHNHPSGVPTPSEQDKRTTDGMRESLNLVEVRLLDHIVVTPHGEWMSVTTGVGGYVDVDGSLKQKCA